MQKKEEEYLFGSASSSDNIELLFNEGTGRGFRLNRLGGYLEYSNDGINWQRVGNDPNGLEFAQEGNNDIADEHLLVGYKTLIGFSKSDAVDTVTFDIAFDDGIYDYDLAKGLTLVQLQGWIDTNVTGNKFTGTGFAIRAVPLAKVNRESDIMVVRLYLV